MTATSSPQRPVRVCVIGGGPGGLFFVHHWEKRRQQQQQQQQQQEQSTTTTTTTLQPLLDVTVFEKASEVGGQWRLDNICDDGLWTNGHKEAMEFFDYNFSDHYGADAKLPTFLPRAAVTDYLLARVTRNAPDLVQRYVKLNTSVQRVTYDATTQLFTVTIRDELTQATTIQEFEKVIWAAGSLAGGPHIPKSLTHALDGFTKGLVVHARHFTDWSSVVDQHVVLIGGSYSALDMAYVAIQKGVRRVTIVVREKRRDIPVLWVDTWPQKKVQLVVDMVPVGVNAETQAILFGTPTPTGERDNEEDSDTEEEETDKQIEESAAAEFTFELTDVDAVILCTGFKYADDMLDYDSIFCGHDVYSSELNEFEVPADWKLNPASYTGVEELDHMPPPRVVTAQTMDSCLSYFFNCVSGYNPNFFFRKGDFDQFLLFADIQMYLVLSILLNETVLPSLSEIENIHKEMILDGLDLPHIRSYHDADYNALFLKLEDSFSEDVSEKYWKQAGVMEMSFVAQMARAGKYPVDFGGWKEGLTPMGRVVVEYNDLYNWGWDKQSRHKTTVHDLSARDCRKIKSMFTGISPVPFKCLWMELDPTMDPLDMVEGNEGLVRRNLPKVPADKPVADESLSLSTKQEQSETELLEKTHRLAVTKDAVYA